MSVVRASAALLAAGWLVVLLPTAAVALPDDRNQPIYIQSDRAERDERKGTTVYTGEVEIDQGSLHISAHRVTIQMEDEQVSQIEATGDLAKMHQKPSPDREPVYARAKTIQYDLVREVLTLLEQAAVTQEGTTVKGERIEYFVQEQRVKASAGNADSGQQRVQMVIPPRRITTPDNGPAPQRPPEPAAGPAPEAAQESVNGAP